MHIKINNNYLTYGNYNVKCAVGKRGINLKKREGDLITPKGIFKIKAIYYRKDRVKELKTKIKKIIITKDIGWCDDPKSKYYNKQIKYPFKYKTERLYRADNIYDIILVLDFNYNPIKKNKGSAIFIHVAKRKLSPTKGCVNKKSELRRLSRLIDKNTVVKIC